MASRSSRRQAAIVTIATWVAQLASSHLGDHQAKGVLRAGQACVATIGALGPRDMKRVFIALEIFRQRVWSGGVDVAEALSMVLCLVIDQMAFIRGRKHAAFQKMLNELETLLGAFHYAIDHGRSYEAALIFSELKL